MKMWTIIKKEYRQIVKKKSFVISTLITPVLMAAFIFLPMLLTKVGREEKTIEVLDFSGMIQEQFVERSESSIEASILKLKFTPAKDTRGSEKQNDLIKAYEAELEKMNLDANLELLPEYKNRILDKKINGLILISKDIKATRIAYFCALNISDFGTNKYITSTVQKILSEKLLIEQNIEPKIVEEAIQDIRLNTFKVKKEGTTRSTSGMEYMMSIFMLTILFSIIMAYGQLIMRGVIEEKNNRIVEVLISSTNVPTLFYGKIIGIGLAGLTQVAFWFIMGAVLVIQPFFKIDTRVVNFLTPEVALYFFIFFVIGYFMYSILYSVVGASVNTDQEAQQFATPITYLLFIPFIIGVIVTQNPNTPFVVISSMFPLFTPTLMFMRISVAIPSLLQIITSMIMSILFTFFLAWLGAKIFRVGILMYGKKPTIKEIFKWIRYK